MLILPLLTTLALPGILGAQAAATAPAQYSGKYTLSGVVVSSSTARPVENASVSLHAAVDGRLVGEMTTGEDGSFSFPNLAAAKYSLTGSHRGYITSSYDEHAEYSTAIVTGEGLVSEGLTFRLPPQAIIYGTVTDDSGDPVEQAQVSLYRQDTLGGMGTIVRTQQTNTDDEGAYEIRHLEPGDYYVSVTARPWYSTKPQRLNVDGTPIPDGTRSPLDVAFPRAYYADVTDPNAATPVPVKPGDHIAVNFTLHPVPAVHLTIQLPQRALSAQGNIGFSMPQIQQDVFGNEDPVPVSASFAGSDPQGPKTMEVTGLAPGEYQVELLSGRGTATHISTINATSDLKIDSSSSSSLAEVSGKLAMADGGKIPGRVMVRLRSREVRFPNGAPVAEDGSFTLHAVPPGSYELMAGSQSGSALAVAHMSASGATVDGHMLVVGNEPVLVAATLVQGSSNITGVAKRNKKPAAGVMVLLIPKDSAADRMLYRRDQSDSDGSFLLPRVIPGDYVLVAIQDGWDLDWARPGVIAHYLPGGLPVRVSAQSDKTIALPQAVEVQAK
ncbi:MAG TPA: carboxypeptidase regulatory-like domain-containing protein [Acidisarcina sp.]